MPGFASIIDQKRPIRILTACLRDGNIPHALLFTGISGIGKHSAAHCFAMACNCDGLEGARQRDAIDEIPCGQCRPCRKVDSGNHPDVISITTPGGILKIGQIRDLCHTLSMRPYEARMRVVLIPEAHKLNPEAGNALLKVLEEPPDRTVLILTAFTTTDLLPTIVSRCQQIRFTPISKNVIAKELTQRIDMNAETASVVATMANGSLSKALNMSDPEWIQYRRWVIQELEDLSAQPVRSVLAFAEKLASQKERISEVLDLILTWLRDLLIVRIDPQKLINLDQEQGVRNAADKVPKTALLAMIGDIERVKKGHLASKNLRLMLESLLLELARI